MTTNLWAPAIAMAVLVSLPVSAQAPMPTPKGAHAKTGNARVERAKERCRLNHGVDCETAQGLQEWLLLDRSRNEAVRDGSRHRVSEQRRPAPSRP
jgi:hypothetical protein